MPTNPPRDLILEPNERVILATRPLFLWEPLVLLDVLLILASLYASAQQQDVAAGVLFVAADAALALAPHPLGALEPPLVRADGPARHRPLGRAHEKPGGAAARPHPGRELAQPFPLRMIRDYGVIHLESAGQHAEERISGGLRELAMTNASSFYRALTDAQTPS